MVSLSAKILERFLRKIQKTYFSKEAVEAANYADEYVWPKNLRLKLKVSKERYMDRNFYILTPKHVSNTTVFYFHGGGYVMPITPPQWKLVEKVVLKAKCKAIVFDYPMIPNHYYKESYDIFMTYYSGYLKTHKNEKIVFMGDSAGGALAAGFYLEAYKQGLRLPDATILISPYLDIAASNPESEFIDDPLLVYSSIKLVPPYWARELDYKDYKVSPLFGDLSLFHNTTVITGTRDVLHPDSRTFIEAIKKDPTNDYLIKEGMYHVYPIFPIRETKEAINLICKNVLDV